MLCASESRGSICYKIIVAEWQALYESEKIGKKLKKNLLSLNIFFFLCPFEYFNGTCPEDAFQCAEVFMSVLQSFA